MDGALHGWCAIGTVVAKYREGVVCSRSWAAIDQYSVLGDSTSFVLKVDLRVSGVDIRFSKDWQR
jgi:hypothetical protein